MTQSTFFKNIKNITIIAFVIHFPLSAMAEPLYCQLVPIMNEIENKNGPIVELCVARQSQVFTEMLGDLSVGGEVVPLYLDDYDVETAWLFASCLTKAYQAEQENSKEAKESLLSQIKNFSPEEGINICNIAQYASVPSLSDYVYDEIIKRPVDRKLFAGMNPDVKKKMASLFIAQNKGDTALLQVYAEKLRKNEHVLEREGWLLRPFVHKRRICYFDSNSNTIVGVIKSGGNIKSFYVTSLHSLQKWSTTLAVLCNKVMSNNEVVIGVPANNFFKRILSVDMNDDETCFICTVLTAAKDKKHFLIDINQKTIAQTDQPFFGTARNDIFSIFLTNDYRPTYTIRNKATNNSWNFNGERLFARETLLYNKQQIIRKRTEGFQKPKLKKTTIVPCVDDTMKDFVTNISLEQLPFVVYTITSQAAGRVALNNCEHEEYENIPQSCRSMIDMMYVITKDDVLSRCAGVARSVYRTVFPYMKTAAVWTVGAAPMVIIPLFLSVLIPRISSKQFAEVLQLTLKM